MAKQQSMLHVLLVRIVQPVFQFHRKYVTKIKLFTLQAVVAEKLRKTSPKVLLCTQQPHCYKRVSFYWNSSIFPHLLSLPLKKCRKIWCTVVTQIQHSTEI